MTFLNLKDNFVLIYSLSLSNQYKFGIDKLTTSYFETIRETQVCVCMVQFYKFRRCTFHYQSTISMQENMSSEQIGEVQS